MGVALIFIEQLRHSTGTLRAANRGFRLKTFAFFQMQKRKIYSQRRVFTVPGRFRANTRSVDAHGAIFMALLIKLGYPSERTEKEGGLFARSINRNKI